MRKKKKESSEAKIFHFYLMEMEITTQLETIPEKKKTLRIVMKRNK